MLSANEIADLLPHGNGMSLIREVITCDQESIQCFGRSHNDSDNPLFSGTGNFSSITLVEYAAQGAAIHASLQKSNLGLSRPAFIGALKNIDIIQTHIPASSMKLLVVLNAEHLGANGAIYQFEVSADEALLISGRLTLVQPVS